MNYTKAVMVNFLRQCLINEKKELRIQSTVSNNGDSLVATLNPAEVSYLFSVGEESTSLFANDSAISAAKKAIRKKMPLPQSYNLALFPVEESPFCYVEKQTGGNFCIVVNYAEMLRTIENTPANANGFVPIEKCHIGMAMDGFARLIAFGEELDPFDANYQVPCVITLCHTKEEVAEMFQVEGVVNV